MSLTAISFYEDNIRAEAAIKMAHNKYIWLKLQNQVVITIFEHINHSVRWVPYH